MRKVATTHGLKLQLLLVAYWSTGFDSKSDAGPQKF